LHYLVGSRLLSEQKEGCPDKSAAANHLNNSITYKYTNFSYLQKKAPFMKKGAQIHDKTITANIAICHRSRWLPN